MKFGLNLNHFLFPQNKRAKTTRSAETNIVMWVPEHSYRPGVLTILNKVY